MTKKYFHDNLIMAVELDYDDMGREWFTMKESEVDEFCKKHQGELSDIDYACKQDDPEISMIIEVAWKNLSANPEKYKNISNAIEALLTDDDEPKKPRRRVWTEEEIRHLIQTNDEVLYDGLRKLYECQTADEKSSASTRVQNGKGFNSVDAKFLTSVSQFLIRTGFLTPKQKAVVRKKLVKYNKQLTAIANA